MEKPTSQELYLKGPVSEELYFEKPTFQELYFKGLVSEELYFEKPMFLLHRRESPWRNAMSAEPSIR